MVFKALTMIFNSTVFSVLAKSGAIALRGGYYKFNKQYLNPAPLPNEKLVPGNRKIRENEFYGLDVNDWTEIEKVGRVVDRVTGKEG